MICPKCSSQNVLIQLQESGAKTRKHGNGLGGIINNFLRLMTAICTLGLSNLIWNKSKGNSITKIENKTVCICQNCGHSWKV